MTPEDRIRRHLEFLYTPDQAREAWLAIQERLEAFRARQPQAQAAAPPSERLSEQDAILITYGDQITEPDRPPLQTLAAFLRARLAGAIQGVHLLPFYPYSSDDGFSVIDYRRVDPALGDWEDVEALGRDFRLMFDAVINHISRESAWFQGFLRGEEPFKDYFLVVEPGTDLSMVVRPRALPLLTPVELHTGETRHVWTTFSEDQIDLNYANPRVLVEMVDLLLYYVQRGAEIIRLDAIAYLWKKIGTPCIHLPETHRVVKLFRAALDAVAPGVILITETNVPHEENISYFGDPLPEGKSTDEAQLVYQFPLAPLVLHTFLAGDARVLSGWAQGLRTPSPAATFFNFIASHDGIGVRPAEGLLSPAQGQALLERTLAHGGKASFRTHADGSRSVYELNITLYDFLNNPKDPDPDRDVSRFLASQAIMLTLAGVPGIYVHSLFGSRNCHACLQATGRPRSINREKFLRDELEASLSDPQGRARRVFDGYRALLQARRGQPAFHPRARQRVLDLHPAVFAVLRGGERAAPFLGLVEVSGRTVPLAVDLASQGVAGERDWLEILSGRRVPVAAGRLRLTLAPYQVAWLTP